MKAMPVKPTEAELTILCVLWDHGPLPVRAVQKVLNEAKRTGYTTVLKLLQIMTAKALVERDEDVRPQVYHARYTRQQTQRHLLRDLLARAFDGSVKDMVLQALATRKPPPEDLQIFEKLLDRWEKDTGRESK
jgi:predicted transcriptional regulator